MAAASIHPVYSVIFRNTCSLIAVIISSWLTGNTLNTIIILTSNDSFSTIFFHTTRKIRKNMAVTVNTTDNSNTIVGV